MICCSIWQLFLAFWGMHVSPAKHSYGSVTDGQTDDGQSDPYVSPCFAGDTNGQTDEGQSDPFVSLCFAGDTKMLSMSEGNMKNDLLPNMTASLSWMCYAIQFMYNHVYCCRKELCSYGIQGSESDTHALLYNIEKVNTCTCRSIGKVTVCLSRKRDNTENIFSNCLWCLHLGINFSRTWDSRIPFSTSARKFDLELVI